MNIHFKIIWGIIFVTTAVLRADVSRNSIDLATFKVLNACAEKNTNSLKGKISQESIQSFQSFCLKSFSDLPLALFVFTPSNEKSVAGKWECGLIKCFKKNNDFLYRARNMFKWLKENYTPKRKLTFFYLLQEPYLMGHKVPQEIQIQFGELLESCPLLISCTHPDLAWTKKAVLIPDDLIRRDSYYTRFEELLSCDTFVPLHDLIAKPLKGLAPFSERKSCIYFSGGLAGPSLPFEMENMKENPRHYLLTLVKDMPYIEVRITDWQEWMHSARSPYFRYLFDAYSHLEGDRVDFFEHAKNKYLLSCDGYGAAWSRVELIMATGSVLLLNAQCEQYFYPLMENNKTHVVINKDFSNLDAEFNRLEDDPECAQKIGEQAREFAKKFFTKGAINAYLWLVLRKLESCSDVQTS